MTYYIMLFQSVFAFAKLQLRLTLLRPSRWYCAWLPRLRSLETSPGGCATRRPIGAKRGGGGRIRTNVRSRGQIYSLLPLTTRPPLRVYLKHSKSVFWHIVYILAPVHLINCKVSVLLIREQYIERIQGYKPMM